MSTTTPVSSSVAERSRKNVSLILQRLASVGQVALAEGLGLSESTVSRLKDGEIERTAKMLALLGLKVVPLDMQCFPQDQVHALFTLAKARMKNMESVDEMSTED